MSDLIFGFRRSVIVALRIIVKDGQNDHSEKTYLSIGKAYEDAARAIGLSQEGELWSIPTKQDDVIEDIKQIFKCKVVEGPSNNGEKAASNGSEE
ncbi:hypothetical protein ACCS93_38030 [Rhizobium ruizarguesonis]